jgi:hypothetical protein
MTLGHSSAAEDMLSCREYTKKDVEQLDIMVRDIQADSKRMRLLQILGQQLELLINEGRSDPDSLFTSLKTEALMSEEEYRELKSIFIMDTVSYSCAVEEATN